MEFLTLIGILFAPVFTLGVILIYYDHPFLGILALIISVAKFINDN